MISNHSFCPFSYPLGMASFVRESCLHYTIGLHSAQHVYPLCYIKSETPFFSLGKGSLSTGLGTLKFMMIQTRNYNSALSFSFCSLPGAVEIIPLLKNFLEVLRLEK